MCGILAALIFSIWIAVYGDSKYTFYKKEYQKYEVTKDLDMTIDQIMYVTDHMMSYLIAKRINYQLSHRLMEQIRTSSMKETGFIWQM